MRGGYFAILHVVRTGCAWRQLPADFPPWQTVCWYFNQREQAKATEKILPLVRTQLRVRGFAVIPRRWAVERTLAWLTAHRRTGPRL
jgi:transposase